MQLNLGACKAELSHRLSIFIPNKDQAGRRVPKIKLWVREAAYILTTINGAATCVAPAAAMWQNTETGDLIEELTQVVYSYCDPAIMEVNDHLIYEFLQRFMEETRQQCVAVEYDGTLRLLTPTRSLPLALVG